MATRGPRQIRGKSSQRVDPVTPCPSRVQQSLALDSAVTLLHATQGVLVEHMWTLSRKEGAQWIDCMGRLEIASRMGKSAPVDRSKKC